VVVTPRVVADTVTAADLQLSPMTATTEYAYVVPAARPASWQDVVVGTTVHTTWAPPGLVRITR
jgi:hypothetical protein